MKKFIIVLVMFAMLNGIVYAQNVPGGFTSPQSTATAGRLRSPADDFIRPSSYPSAGVTSTFLMTSFASENTVHFGYAQKFGDLYFAGYYGGSFWLNTVRDSYTEQTVPWLNNSNKAVPVYNNIPSISGVPDNRFSFLVGMMDMGFRLSLITTYRSFSNTDFLDSNSNTGYKSFDTANGHITPQIAWSMAKNFSDNGIRPFITIDLGFIRNYRMSETYNMLDGTSGGVAVANSQNYFQPVVNMGLGGYNLATLGGFRISADFEYRFTLRMYKNEYSYLDSSSKFSTSTIKGLNTNGVFSENSYFENLFTPSLSASRNIDKIALRANFSLPFTIRNEGETGMDIQTNSTSGSLVKNGIDGSMTTLIFQPRLRVAAQWRFIPQIALNVGGDINVMAMNRSVAKGETFTNGVKDTDSSYKSVSIGNKTTTNRLTAGFSINATSNMTIEAVCGMSSSNSVINANNRISFFDPADGLFSFGSLLLSFRF
jgi:hypothetical protein